MARKAGRPRDERGRFLSARQISARKGAATRERNRIHAQLVHGQQARERTEKRLTPAQKGARTREANRLEREIRTARRSEAAKRGWITRRENMREPPSPAPARDNRIFSLDDLDDFDPDDQDFEEYDIETSPDYEET
jgi:hypothetical protein